MPITSYYGSTVYGAKTPHKTHIAASSKSKNHEITSPQNEVKKSRFLTGNTASLSKVFNCPKSTIDYQKQSENMNSTPRNYLGAISKRLPVAGENSNLEYKRPTKYDVGSYTSRYANCIQAKMNETQQKNTKIKSQESQSEIMKRQNESGSICRNRPIVRFTVKKDQAPIASIAYNNPVKSIAQKLLEKYTISEKKEEDKLLYVPTNKWAATNSLPPVEFTNKVNEKPPKLPDYYSNRSIRSSENTSIVNTLESHLHIKTDTGHEGDDELSDCEEKDTEIVDSAKIACMKNDLQSPEEVKEAIVAAILHPGIDIESDEELKLLVNEQCESDRGSKRKSIVKKKDSFVWRRKSDADTDGEIIVDKLKRYVKQQLSYRNNSSKKLTSNLVNSTAEDNEKRESSKSIERIIPINIEEFEYTKEITTKEVSSSNIDNIIPLTSRLIESEVECCNQNGVKTNSLKVIFPNVAIDTIDRESVSEVTESIVTNEHKLLLNDVPLNGNIFSKSDEMCNDKDSSYNDRQDKFKDIVSDKNDNCIVKSDSKTCDSSTNEIDLDRLVTKIYSDITETNISEGYKNNHIESVSTSKSNIDYCKDVQLKNSINRANSYCAWNSELKHTLSSNSQLNFSFFDADNNTLEDTANYNLRKSATSQITSVEDNLTPKFKPFIDTESISFSNSLDMKPSLLQFLEDSKSELIPSIGQDDHIVNIESQPDEKYAIIDKDNTIKNVLKRPRLINTTIKEVKSSSIDVLSARKILKRPVKPIKQLNSGGTGKMEIIKPKKIWKKPTIIETSAAVDKCDELKNVLGGLKNQKLKAMQQASSSTVINKKLTKTQRDNKKMMQSKSSTTAATKDVDPIDKTQAKSIRVNKKLTEKHGGKKVSSDPTDNSFPAGNGGRKSETSISTLSTSLSADSAYGSSPSTPQPRTNDILEKNTVKVKNSNNPKRNSEIIEDICELCSTNCHKKCEKQMPNLCGVNQKLLAEALSSVKKGGPSADGRDAFRTLNVATTSKSTPSISSSETETTTTDDDETDTDSSEFNGPAEIRSPIQTRPKFKKYNLNDFNFIKVLGKGSFGKVMLAQQVNTENYFAVKCLKKDVVLEDNDVECCLIERKVLTLGTKHPYLCHLFCSFQTPSHLFFVMEYLTGGDLMFHIQHVGRFDEYRACFYGAEIISGLKFLHNKGIIYRDLKLDNMLLDYQGHIRIADFGMCKLQIYLDRFADTFCGTPDYMAPEVIKGQHYNQCVDWWSFGVLLYEMMVGKSPFKGCDEDHLFWLICNEEPFYPRFLSIEAQSILKQLLDKDSSRRLGPPYNFYGEIKCHPFFKYIDWNKIERKEVETPYKPRLRHILDVQYFDRLFTKRNAVLTPLDTSILESMDQTPFKEFSYTNPNITD